MMTVPSIAAKQVRMNRGKDGDEDGGRERGGWRTIDFVARSVCFSIGQAGEENKQDILTRYISKVEHRQKKNVFKRRAR